MSNLAVFEAQTAEIFSLLYESFPVKIDVYRHQVSKGLKPIDSFGDELDFPSSVGYFDDYYASFDVFSQSDEYQKEYQVFSATMDWLSSSGYIAFGSLVSYDYYEDVVLTAKGLEVLKCTPSCIDGSLSLGEKLKEETLSSGSDVARDLVKQALREGLKMAIGI
ncbi:TPA: hypothetical protein RQJ47_004549 [Vibrio vulnificus]|uniref:hypothetical protein n=1 Tax=Vibrio TaxID=662 RepID=UPI000693334A|nr:MULTISPECIES: hypothetical protein [Vibrio]EGR0930211.1 hypothetical protein [Vibrio parahaemolyticus]ELA9430789.1 hypothetical protein [Vibrio parahaemolyticus]MBE3707319.1 hypothetical protein [Vibrio parahaemolyticus]MBE4257160.1 hypothetical protein [Vibrio parahaemolyticus]MDS1873124.1 hypothetical protein [Vibrio vulnificus]